MRMLCFLFFSSLFIFSCTKDKNISNVVCQINSINGRIDNWDLGTGKVLKFCHYGLDTFEQLDSSIISANGDFFISLKRTPKLNLINWGDSVNINNKNTMISDGFMELLIYSNNKKIGFVVFGKNASYSTIKYAGDYRIDYYYVDNDVRIVSSKYKEKINLNFSHGWNKYLLKYILGFPYYSGFPDSYSIELTTYFSENDLTGAKWLYYLDNLK